jgi:hypothetical protein
MMADRTPSHAPYFAHRTEHTADTHPTQKIMTNQVSINLDASVIDSYEQLITTFFQQLKNQIKVNDSAVADIKPKNLAPFNEFITEELTPVFGKNIAKRIVSLLEVCRRSYDFTAFRQAYRWAKKDDIEQRQLLLTVSAVYRYKFGILEHDKSKLKSQIKWDTKCPHCGSLAIKMVERMKVEGLWV